MTNTEDVWRYADAILAMIKEDQDNGQIPRSVATLDELDDSVDTDDYYRQAQMPSGIAEAASLRNAVTDEVCRRLARSRWPLGRYRDAPRRALGGHRPDPRVRHPGGSRNGRPAIPHRTWRGLPRPGQLTERLPGQESHARGGLPRLSTPCGPSGRGAVMVRCLGGPPTGQLWTGSPVSAHWR